MGRLGEAMAARREGGRKSFVPTMPVRVQDGLLDDATLPDALTTQPWWRRSPREAPDNPLRIVLETDPAADGEVRNDVPLDFVSSRRRFTVRHVRAEQPWTVPAELIKEWPRWSCES